MTLEMHVVEAQHVKIKIAIVLPGLVMVTVQIPPMLHGWLKIARKPAENAMKVVVQLVKIRKATVLPGLVMVTVQILPMFH